jgi:hypothetical protein
VKVTLNDAVIVDVDLDSVGDASRKCGPRTQGYIGFLGHTNHIEFRKLRIREL